MIAFIMGLVIGLVQGIVGLGLLYHYILLLAGGRARREGSRAPASGLRLAVALPAHNEAAVIGATVACLRRMTYAPDLFDIHVVADFCSDDTAAMARSAGAIVHEREAGRRGRKGYALAWLFERLLADPAHYDAIVVFDADSRPAPDFLSAMAEALSEGAQVVQGRHVIANPDAGSFAALADGDMRLNNRIRNQAKENLGLSARLMGDAMCFRREILERHPWVAAESLTEDREYGIYLTAQGERVRFAGQAVSAGQAAARWQDATGQRLRWYGGIYDLQKRYVRTLLAAAWQRRSLAALDLALELTVPPFSQLSFLAVGLFGARVVWALLDRDIQALALPGLSLALAGLYPFIGLTLERAPARTIRVLALGPAYAAWRVWINLRVRLKRGQVAWVRTRRTEEISRFQ